jgi:osmotically-inducible protein OsmY
MKEDIAASELQRIADSELQRDVLDELKCDLGVNVAHVGVSAKKGIVTLSGYVLSYWEKHAAAEKSAKRVYGVMAVANESSRSSCRTAQPAHRRGYRRGLRERPQVSISIPSDKIKVVVSKGWVTLEGEVEWQYQKRAAENAIRYLTVVMGVSSLIVIKPRVSPTKTKSKIEDAFKRSAELDARRISVEVNGSEVTLRGHVRS